MAYTSEIDKLERRHRENPEGRTFAPLADAYRKAGDIPRALEILRTGLQRHPEYLSASIVLGRCHLDLGDLAAAESAFRRVLELDKENVIAIKALADITERQARFDEAEHWLNYLLSIDSSNDEARQQLSRLDGAREQHAQRSAQDDQASEESAAPAGETLAEPESLNVPASSEANTVEISPIERAQPAAPPPPPESEPVLEEPAVAETAPWAPPSEPAYEAPVEAETIPLAPLVEMAEPEAPAEPLSLETDEREETAATAFVELEEDPMQMPSSTVQTFDVGVERHEEIVLRPSSTSEFQVPSDAELLRGARSSDETPPFEEDAPPPPVEEFTPPDLSVTDLEELITSELEELPGAEPEPAEASAELAERDAVTAEDLWQAHPEDATVGASAPEEPPVPTPEPVAPPMNLGEPLVTETIGDLYAAQGHHAQALRVYRQLLQRSPNDHRLTEKIEELESRQPVPAPGSQRGFAAADTGGQSVLSYFGDLLAARLPASNGAPAEPEVGEPAGEPASTGFMEEAFRTDEEPVSGEPTRPASGPLSLSAIFGEDSSPVPPVVAGPESPETQPQGSHFDEFFGERPTQQSGTIRARSVRLDADQDDLDQFHKWLKGLKR